MLNPEPTPDEIEQVRKIVNVTSTALIIDRMNQHLTDAGWAEIRLDITEWKDNLKNEHTIIDGGGVNIDNDRNRLDIRNRVRVALGFPEVNLAGTVIEDEIFIFPSVTIPKKIGW